MKLHLPKVLFAAVLAAACGSAFGTTITVGGQEYDAAILTSEATEAPDSNYFLIASNQTVQNTTHNTWMMDLDNTKTIISAPASDGETEYSGNTLFFDTGGKGSFTVNANILAGGFSGNALRFWGGSNVTLNGTLTVLNALNIWNENSTHYLNGAVNANEATVNITGAGKTVLGGGGTIGTLNKTNGNGNIELSAGTYDITNISLGNGRTITNSGATLNVTGTVNIGANATEIAPRAQADGNGFSRQHMQATIVNGNGTTNFDEGVVWQFNGTTDTGATYANGVLTGTETDSTHYYVYNGGSDFNLSDAAGATQMTVNTPGQTVDLGDSSHNYTNLTINKGTVKTTHSDKNGFVTGAVVINAGGKLQLAGSNDALGYNAGGGNFTDSITINGSAREAAVLDAATSGNHSITLSGNLVLNGDAKVISSTGDNSFNTFGGNFTVSGTRNEIAVGLSLRNDSTFTVNNGALVTLSGDLKGHKDGTVWSNSTLTKNGNGTLIITGDITGGSGRLNSTAGTTLVKSATITGQEVNNGFILQGVTFSDDAHTVNGRVKLQGTNTLQGSLTNNGALTIAGTVNVNSSNAIVGETAPDAQTNGFSTAKYLVYSGNEATLDGDVTWQLFGSADGVTYTYDGDSQQATLSSADGLTKRYYIHTAEGWDVAGAKEIVVDTNDTTNKVAFGNGAYAVDTLTINSGVVETTHSDEAGFISNGDIVMNGGTLVVAGGHDALGWGNGAVKTLTMENATLKLNQNTNNTLTMKTDLIMKGNSSIVSDNGKSFNSFGTTITATGTDNVIDTGIMLRKHLVIDVQGEDDTLVINNGLHHSTDSVDNNLTVNKTGAGKLTINGGLDNYGMIQAQEGTLEIAGTINGRTEQTNLTLKNVTLKNGGAQDITGTVVLDNVAVTNRLDVKGNVTMQNGVTNTAGGDYSLVVGGSELQSSLTFAEGTYDLTQNSKGIAVYKGSSMTVQNGATVNVKAVSYTDTLADNGTLTVDKGGTLNLTGSSAMATQVQKLDANGTVTAAANLLTNGELHVGGSYTQSGGTGTVGTFLDLGENAVVNIGNGNMVVRGTANTEGIWFKSGSHIDLTGTGTLSADGLVISADGSGTSSIKATAAEAQIGSNSENFQKAILMENTNVKVTGDTLRKYAISGGSVTIGASDAPVTTNIQSALSATTALTVSEGSTATISDTAVSVATLDATNASLVLNNSLTVAGGTVTVDSLTLGNNATITIGEHDGTLAITSSVVVGLSTTVNADLVVADNAIMDFSASSPITLGCTVQIGDGVTLVLNSSEIAAIMHGQELVIIAGAEGDTLAEAVQLGTGIQFIDENNHDLNNLGLRLDTVATATGWNVVVAPEPATATLSLLALAALAARRKRH